MKNNNTNNNEVCINNIYTYLKYINNNNYNTIIYLILNKNFTYKYELNSLLGVNDWKYYFNKLLKAKIIVDYNLTPDEDSYLIWKGKTGRVHITRSKYYGLNPNLSLDFEEKLLIDLINNNVSKKIKDYVLDYKAKLKINNYKFNNIKTEEQSLKEFDQLYLESVGVGDE